MSMQKPKIGRNDPCPCHSGKKYKKCHGKSTSLADAIQSLPPVQQPFSVGRLTPARPGHSAQPFSVQGTAPSQVPNEVMEKAMHHFAEHQQREQARISRLGQVRPEIAGDFRGHKFIAIGNKLMYMPSEKCRFFTDVLTAYVPILFGRDWFDREIANPPNERHPVMQWRVKGINFMNSLPPLPDGSRAGTPTGPLQAYLTFAYDLYVVEHNARLDARLLERLMRSDQFQGARHELFAEATCLRAGFEIEHEDETDPSRRHVEFTAKHKATGQRLSVEAKSKHRPGVLGQAGARQSEGTLDLPFGKLLNQAVAKNPPYPLVVFLDMNMPFQSAQRFLGQRPPHPFIVKTLDRMRKEHGGKDPINLLVITNHPQHYTKDDEIAQSAHLLAKIGFVPEREVQRPEALLELLGAAQLYGNIPHELSTDFR